jgi:hypothetical protein
LLSLFSKCPRLAVYGGYKYLGYLGKYDTNRVVSLCVTSSMVSKAIKSKVVVASIFCKKKLSTLSCLNGNVF